MLLDQEGVEIDGVERREGDTCLHKAVRYVNSLSKEEWEEGQAIVEILIDAGCDPRCVIQLTFGVDYKTDEDMQDTQQGQAAPYRPHRPAQHRGQECLAKGRVYYAGW